MLGFLNTRQKLYLKSQGVRLANFIEPLDWLATVRHAVEGRCIPAVGDRLTQEEMRRMLSSHSEPGIKIFIETGTLQAANVVNLAPVFEETHSIDLSRPLYLAADRSFGIKTRFGIHFHHGDSAEVLPVLLAKMDEPVVIYLDGHYCKDLAGLTAAGEFPLWKELECIRQRPYADIVIVDDVHTFGLKRPDLEERESGRGWEHVSTEAILDGLQRDRVADHYILRDEFVVHRSSESTS